MELFNHVLIEANALNSCLPCKHFDEEHEMCMRHLARPPARVIAYGCQDFDEKENEAS